MMAKSKVETYGNKFNMPKVLFSYYNCW